MKRSVEWRSPNSFAVQILIIGFLIYEFNSIHIELKIFNVFGNFELFLNCVLLWQLSEIHSILLLSYSSTTFFKILNEFYAHIHSACLMPGNLNGAANTFVISVAIVFDHTRISWYQKHEIGSTTSKPHSNRLYVTLRFIWYTI